MPNEAMGTPIITTPGRYRTRSGEVVVLVLDSESIATGNTTTYSFIGGFIWDRVTGKEDFFEQFDITEKIDGGAE